MREKIYSLVVSHMDKVHLTVHAYKSAVESWRLENSQKVKELSEEIFKLEKEADSLRRKIIRDLAEMKISYAKKEFYRRLVYANDEVADLAKISSRFLFSVDNSSLSERVSKDVLKMSSLCQTASARLKDGVYNLKKAPAMVFECATEIDELEETIDELEFSLQQQIKEQELNVYSTLMLWRLILSTGRIADKIEDAADELLGSTGFEQH